MKASRILKEISPEVLEKYLTYQITSIEVGLILGVNSVSVRRAIKRKLPREKSIAERKREMVAVRQIFRKSIAHKTPQEIMDEAHVSYNTALRIKRRYA